MAQNVTVAGASYSDVPAVQLPKTGGGTATFVDETETPFVVTLSWDDDYFGQDDGAWIPDKTFAEISAAYSAGKEIVTVVDGVMSDYQSSCGYSDEDDEFVYAVMDLSTVDKVWSIYVMTSSELFEEGSDTYHITDPATISSNGQLLNGIKAVGSDGTVYTGNILTKTSSDLSANGATVTAPAGYYASNATKTVASGTEGTPTATKGTVSNHAVTVTPSVTNSAGYISGGTKTGTGVQVTASELLGSNLVSVTQSLTNVTSSTNATEAVSGESFFCELTPASGYYISSITVTMGGVDITDQVFKAGTGAKTITANGTYSAASDNLSGYTAVSVNVPSGSASLGTKSISSNGTYNASSDSLDGYSQVTVNVPNTYAAGDEGKVVSNGALVAQTSDTVTQNGTVDTTLISSLLVAVAGGSSVKTGTVTPSAASTTISFDAGLSTITGILVMPINTPLTGSRTQAAMICLPSGSFYKAISIHTNSGGTGWVSPSVYTSNRYSLSGTTVTVTGAYNFRPAVGYVWYAW